MRLESLKCIVLGILSLAFLSAAGAEKDIVVTRDGCEMTFPDEWTVDKYEMPEIKAINGKATVTISFHEYNLRGRAPDLRGFVDHQLINQYWNAPGFLLFTRTRTKIGDADAYSVMIGDANYPQRTVYFLLKGDRGYQIETFQGKDDEKIAKEIDGIVRSFKLVEVK